MVKILAYLQYDILVNSSGLSLTGQLDLDVHGGYLVVHGAE